MAISRFVMSSIMGKYFIFLLILTLQACSGSGIDVDPKPDDSFQGAAGQDSSQAQPQSEVPDIGQALSSGLAVDTDNVASIIDTSKTITEPATDRSTLSLSEVSLTDSDITTAENTTDESSNLSVDEDTVESVPDTPIVAPEVLTENITTSLPNEPTTDSDITISENTTDKSSALSVDEGIVESIPDAPAVATEVLTDNVITTLPDELPTGSDVSVIIKDTEHLVDPPVIVLPSTDDHMLEGDTFMFSWDITPAVLAIAVNFEMLVSGNSGFGEEVIYKDNLLTPSICNDAGRCSVEIDSRELVFFEGKNTWQVRVISQNKESDFTKSSFNVDKPLVETNGFINDSAIYVTASGNDGNDGSTEANALGSIQHAIDKSEPGYTIYVKAGFYPGQLIRISTSGTEDKPIIIEGYKNIPGDQPSYDYFDNTTSLDDSLMPVLDGGSRTNEQIAVYLLADHVVLKNIQLTNYKAGISVRGASNSTVDNVIIKNVGNPSKVYDGYGITLGGGTNNTTIKNSIVVNSTGEAISVVGNANLIDGNKVYSDDNSNGMDSNTDYYLVLHKSYDNIISNNYIERVGDLTHDGHGYTVKGPNENNIFDGNTAVNIKGGGFVARHTGARNNIFRNGIVIGGNGLLARDGANNNLFENMTVSNVSYGIWTFSVKEDETNTNDIAASNNTFKNIEINNARTAAISFRPYGNLSKNNVFDNIKIDTSPYVFIIGQNSNGNMISNSTINSVGKWAYVQSPATFDTIGISIGKNMKVTNSGFVLD